MVMPLAYLVISGLLRDVSRQTLNRPFIQSLDKSPHEKYALEAFVQDTVFPPDYTYCYNTQADIKQV